MVSRVLALALGSLAIVGTALPGASSAGRSLQQFSAKATAFATGVAIPANAPDQTGEANSYKDAFPSQGDVVSAQYSSPPGAPNGEAIGRSDALASSPGDSPNTGGGNAEAVAENTQTGYSVADATADAIAEGYGFPVTESYAAEAIAKATAANSQMGVGTTNSVAGAIADGSGPATALADALNPASGTTGDSDASALAISEYNARANAFADTRAMTEATAVSSATAIQSLFTTGALPYSFRADATAATLTNTGNAATSTATSQAQSVGALQSIGDARGNAAADAMSTGTGGAYGGDATATADNTALGTDYAEGIVSAEANVANAAFTATASGSNKATADGSGQATTSSSSFAVNTGK